MNFHDLEMSVIRHAEANKLLDGFSPPSKMLYSMDNLHDAMATRKREKIADAMGRCALDMIVLCAMLDIDLAKCLEQAFAKISAKPEAPSNVLFLKKE